MTSLSAALWRSAIKSNQIKQHKVDVRIIPQNYSAAKGWYQCTAKIYNQPSLYYCNSISNYTLKYNM